MEEMFLLKLTGGPLSGVEIPLSPFATGKKWLLVLALRKRSMWRIRQAWELKEKPNQLAEGRYLYQRSYKSGKKLIYAFVQGSGTLIALVRKIPTIEDYLSYDGAHTFHLWNRLSDSWLCPGCGRSKFEIMRWTTRRFKKGVGKCPPYKDWIAPLHKHHDHAKQYSSSLARFPITIICDQCNSADGFAKRQLKLPKSFSFTPEEIRQFVIPKSHGRHRIDLAKAWEIFQWLMSKGLV